jgi:hypothetical protein
LIREYNWSIVMQNIVKRSHQKLILDLIKISFIYSMIKEGWKFKHISDSVFEFKKSRALVNDIDIHEILNKI